MKKNLPKSPKEMTVEETETLYAKEEEDNLRRNMEMPPKEAFRKFIKLMMYHKKISSLSLQAPE